MFNTYTYVYIGQPLVKKCEILRLESQSNQSTLLLDVSSISYSPKTMKLSKHSWTSQNSYHPWRISIEDPFEDYDLGRVIHSTKGYHHLVSQFRLALLTCLVYLKEGKDTQGTDDLWSRLITPHPNPPVIEFTCQACGSTGKKDMFYTYTYI